MIRGEPAPVLEAYSLQYVMLDGLLNQLLRKQYCHWNPAQVAALPASIPPSLSVTYCRDVVTLLSVRLWRLLQP
jgi:hypothetical protein